MDSQLKWPIGQLSYSHMVGNAKCIYWKKNASQKWGNTQLEWIRQRYANTSTLYLLAGASLTISWGHMKSFAGLSFISLLHPLTDSTAGLDRSSLNSSTVCLLWILETNRHMQRTTHMLFTLVDDRIGRKYTEVTSTWSGTRVAYDIIRLSARQQATVDQIQDFYGSICLKHPRQQTWREAWSLPGWSSFCFFVQLYLPIPAYFYTGTTGMPRSQRPILACPICMQRISLQPKLMDKLIICGCAGNDDVEWAPFQLSKLGQAALHP